MKISVHKLADGGIGVYPLNPLVQALMTRPHEDRPFDGLAWQIAKFMEPFEDWIGYPEAIATEWILAVYEGGLTEDESIDLLRRRIDTRWGYTESSIIEEVTLPYHTSTDRYFRDALVWVAVEDGRCKWDKVRADVIHMDRIRDARNVQLDLIDKEIAKAEDAGTGNPGLLRQARQTLRDIPQTFDLSNHTTPEELKAAWPTELTERG